MTVTGGDVDAAVASLRGGGLAVIPTDTVYGLACEPYHPQSAHALRELKGRSPQQPIALVAASIDVLLECVPELRGRAGRLARALFPGALTLVVPNPACRYPWLSGARADTIGVRVPDLTGPGKEIVERMGAVAATSANLHGGQDPRRLEDVPVEITSVAAVVDGGELPGAPSTVLDLTGVEPKVLRAGAVPSGEALARVTAALAQ